MYKPKHKKTLRTQLITYYDIVDFISKLLNSIDVNSYYEVEDGTLEEILDYINSNKHPLYTFERYEDEKNAD